MNRKNVATEVNRSKFMFAIKRSIKNGQKVDEMNKKNRKKQKNSIESVDITDIDDRKVITIRIPNILIIVIATIEQSRKKKMKQNCRSKNVSVLPEDRLAFIGLF